MKLNTHKTGKCPHCKKEIKIAILHETKIEIDCIFE